MKIRESWRPLPTPGPRCVFTLVAADSSPDFRQHCSDLIACRQPPRLVTPNPDPVTPDPVKPDPVDPDPVNPDPVKPDANVLSID
ncbi:hypothetical protein DV737_g3572, partial [Chaetothyriales sp. CBS 132003]